MYRLKWMELRDGLECMRMVWEILGVRLVSWTYITLNRWCVSSWYISCVLLTCYETIDVLHPDSGSSKVFSHVNPWNFTARMMIINPIHLLKLLMTPYDVVHVVMPANISCMWVLAAFKIYRCLMVSTCSLHALFSWCNCLVKVSLSASIQASPSGLMAL